MLPICSIARQAQSCVILLLFHHGCGTQKGEKRGEKRKKKEEKGRKRKKKKEKERKRKKKKEKERKRKKKKEKERKRKKKKEKERKREEIPKVFLPQLPAALSRSVATESTAQLLQRILLTQATVALPPSSLIPSGYAPV
jgi:outer membrane biosynthesis protein TonB